ncbi:MAG: glutaredoxin family protein [bacterium]
MSLPKVQFITKEGGCSLCDDLFVELESAREFTDFDLEILKIEQDETLHQKYWDKIPVILVDGKLVVKYRATRDELIRKIEGRSVWKFW